MLRQMLIALVYRGCLIFQALGTGNTSALWSIADLKGSLHGAAGWGAGTPSTGLGAGPSETPGGGTAGARLSETLGCGPAKGPKAAHISSQDCNFRTGKGILGHMKASF